MDGEGHKTVQAAVSKSLANTYLGPAKTDTTTATTTTRTYSSDTKSSNPDADGRRPSLTLDGPYRNASADVLAKAQDHMVDAIKTLRPLMESVEETRRCWRARRRRAARRESGGDAVGRACDDGLEEREKHAGRPPAAVVMLVVEAAV